MTHHCGDDLLDPHSQQRLWVQGGARNRASSGGEEKGADPLPGVSFAQPKARPVIIFKGFWLILGRWVGEPRRGGGGILQEWVFEKWVGAFEPSEKCSPRGRRKTDTPL